MVSRAPGEIAKRAGSWNWGDPTGIRQDEAAGPEKPRAGAFLHHGYHCNRADDGAADQGVGARTSIQAPGCVTRSR